MTNIKFFHKNNNKNVILFVHGFTGGEETWKNSSGVFFPQLLLTEEKIKKHFDIALFNYHTKLFDFKDLRSLKNIIGRKFFGTVSATKKNLSVDKLGDLLKTTIDFHCESYENIIIVAHSMGGLVTKSYILNAIKESSCKVKLFISLSVPHKGVDWARFGKMLFRGHKQVIDLSPLSDRLDLITNDWIQESKGLPKTIYLYGYLDEVVLEKSAVGYQKEKQIGYPFEEDHFTIAKPESKDKTIYIAVEKYLVEFTNEDKRTPIDLIIGEMRDIGDGIYGTIEGNKVTEELYRVCRELGNYFDKRDIRNMVSTGDGTISRKGVNALNILYDKFPEHIKGLNLIEEFENEPLLNYICKLRERYIGTEAWKLIMNKEEIDWKIGKMNLYKEANLSNECIPRGTSVILDYIYTEEK